MAELIRRGLVKAVPTQHPEGEFVTEQRLSADIKAALNNASGRASLEHLSDAVRLIKGELITQTYLDGLGSSTQEKLSQLGRLTVAGLASEHDLPLEVIEECVTAWLADGRIAATLCRGAIETDQYQQQLSQALQQQCSATSSVLAVSDLAAAHGVDDRRLVEVLRALVAQKLVSGTVTSREYVPDAYKEAQQEAAIAFLSANNYLDQARAAKWGLTQDAILARCPGTQLVASYYIAPPLPAAVAAALEEAAQRRWWCDATESLPPALPTEVVGALLERSCAAVVAVAMAEVYGVSKNFLEDALAEVKSVTRNAVASATAPKNTAQSTSSAKSKKEERARKGSKKASTVEEAHISAADICLQLQEDYPDLQELPDLSEALAAYLHRPVLEAHMEAAAAAAATTTTVFDGELAAHHRAQEAFEKSVLQQWAMLHLLAKGAACIGGSDPGTRHHHLRRRSSADSAASDEHADDLLAVNRHLLRSCGARLARSLTERAFLDAEVDWAWEGGAEQAETLTVRRMVQSEHPDVPAFLSHAETKALPACGVVAHRIDKRAERQMLAAEKQRLAERLKEERSPPQVLRLALTALFQQANHAIVTVPKGLSGEALFQRDMAA
ncbi:hypothetical protein JKP88DRAFT_349760 [Tribonema minus]|uniref:Uncharacterized protein n=1 Tax=Tribonema minus TaxID=303371 RepID=A0A836CBB4_9STRA|nr:hypothetical protein JKP88DRAFT_349760 [Tribonema minus]